jgi:hypothetical protein
MHTNRRSRTSPGRFDLRAVRLKDRAQALGGEYRAVGDLSNPFQEERDPRFPVSVAADTIQEVVVRGAIPFEIEAEVEERVAEDPRLAEQQRDEETADAAVAVEKRMDRLELHVRQGRAQEHRHAVALRVKELLELRHALGNRRVWRRHESGVSRSRATNPVLGAAEFARILPASAAAGEEDSVDLSNQAIRKWEPVAQSSETVVERGDVVGDLGYVVQRHARRFIQLEEEQIRERRLRPLDLGGEHRFLSDVGVEEERLVREQRGDAVQPTDRQDGPFEQRLQ